MVFWTGLFRKTQIKTNTYTQADLFNFVLFFILTLLYIYTHLDILCKSKERFQYTFLIKFVQDHPCFIFYNRFKVIVLLSWRIQLSWTVLISQSKPVLQQKTCTIDVSIQGVGLIYHSTWDNVMGRTEQIICNRIKLTSDST